MSSVLQLIDERQESQRISPLLTAPDLSYSGCIGAIGVEGFGFGVEGLGLGLYRGYMGRMEKNMETHFYGFTGLRLSLGT